MTGRCGRERFELRYVVQPEQGGELRNVRAVLRERGSAPREAEHQQQEGAEAPRKNQGVVPWQSGMDDGGVRGEPRQGYG